MEPRNEHPDSWPNTTRPVSPQVKPPVEAFDTARKVDQVPPTGGVCPASKYRYSPGAEVFLDSPSDQRPRTASVRAVLMFPGGRCRPVHCPPQRSVVRRCFDSRGSGRLRAGLFDRAGRPRRDGPQRLPEVLRALTPLLGGLARVLAKLPTGLPANECAARCADVQLGDPSTELPEEAS